MTRRKNPVAPLEAMPDWMRALKGFDELKFRRADHEAGDASADEANPATEAGSNPDTWRIMIAMPREIESAAERIDPILFLPGLAGAIEHLDERIAEIVEYCRGHGRSWTQIGEALSISKQAAWERFSGEE
jgi:hypothetical protein